MDVIDGLRRADKSLQCLLSVLWSRYSGSVLFSQGAEAKCPHLDRGKGSRVPKDVWGKSSNSGIIVLFW